METTPFLFHYWSITSFLNNIEMTQPIDWEKEFDDKCSMHIDDGGFSEPWEGLYPEPVKDFIKSLLTSQHNTTVQECMEVATGWEGIGYKGIGDTTSEFGNGYDAAVSDIIKSLRELLK